MFTFSISFTKFLQDQNDAQLLELPVLHPCERVPAKQVPIEELIYRLADRVGLRSAKRREGRPYGAVRRIVATTKEYVESRGRSLFAKGLR